MVMPKIHQPNSERILFMKILGIDLGDTRTGLAVSDPTGFLATPIGTITETSLKETAKQIAQKVTELKIDKIVLGLPKNMNGTLGARAEKSERFAETLRELTGLEVILFDERCTTMNAHQILNLSDTRGKKRKSAIDTLSAAIILQNYLDSKKG